MSEPALYVEPVLGWRVWHVEVGADGPELLSWSRPYRWPARQRMEALCRRLWVWRVKPHPAPAAGHRCGLYAMRRREDLEQILRPLFAHGPPGGAGRRAIAIGRVSLWGRTIANVRGWRAQYGYPYELEVVGADEELCRDLAARYAVDVCLAPGTESLPGMA